MYQVYTFVGSRSAPNDILEDVQELARLLAMVGWTLRSGRAPGVDLHAEFGADDGNGAKEIFLPYPGFPRYVKMADGRRLHPHQVLKDVGKSEHTFTQEAWDWAKEFLGQDHWNSRGMVAKRGFGRKAHARNFHQVLGLDLQTPSKFLVCWAPRIRGDSHMVKGGTNTAVCLAYEQQIPIINMVDTDWEDQFIDVMKEYNLVAGGQ